MIQRAFLDQCSIDMKSTPAGTRARAAALAAGFHRTKALHEVNSANIILYIGGGGVGGGGGGGDDTVQRPSRICTLGLVKCSMIFFCANKLLGLILSYPLFSSAIVPLPALVP